MSYSDFTTLDKVQTTFNLTLEEVSFSKEQDFIRAPIMAIVDDV